MTTYDHAATLDAALSAYGAGDIVGATAHARLATINRADDAEGWSILGLCLARGTASVEEAIACLSKATDMEPSEPRWWLHLGISLLDMGKPIKAEQALSVATERSNGNPQAMTKWGDALMACGRASDAAQIYGRVLQAQQSPAVWIKAGDALTAARDTINAVFAYEKAYSDADRPDGLTAAIADMHINLGNYDRAAEFNQKLRDKNLSDPDAGFRAANLLRWQGDLDKAKALQAELWAKNKSHARLTAAMIEDGNDVALNGAKAVLSDTMRPEADRRRVAFALTHFYDKAGERDIAWDYAETANALYTEIEASPAQSIDAMADMLKAAIKAYRLMPDGEVAAPRMIYVIGPPRSGGSLLQTVLSRVPNARSVGERGALLSWLPQLLDTPAKLAEILDQLRASDAAGMAKAVGEAEIYIDKTPHHVLVAGLLSKVHAGAKFVAPTRSRADMAVSLYFHEFGPEFAFTRKLDDIQRYLDFHADAVAQWHAAGVDIVAHDHDVFAADPAAHGPELCAALDLPWSEAMLQNQADDGAVRTFSARQVRSGISTRFAGRGARYAHKLGKAFEA